MKLVKVIVDYGIPGVVREFNFEVEDWVDNKMISQMIETEITEKITYEWNVEEV